MPELFVKPRYLEMIFEILDSYCPQAEVWAYGSRINGRAHDGSDLDLAVKNSKIAKVNIYKLKELFVESNIPFLIDLHDYEMLPESFKDEIDRQHVVIYPRQNV